MPGISISCITRATVSTKRQRFTTSKVFYLVVLYTCRDARRLVVNLTF